MPDCFLGLDLGQAADPSALAVLTAEEAEGARAYTVGYLHRWHLGTRYPAVVQEVGQLLARPPQAEPPYDPALLAGSPLAVDVTGVGKPVLEMFEDAGLDARLWPVLITGGHHETLAEGGVWHVPKKVLVSTLQVLFQTRRLRIAPELEHAKTLAKELENFRVRVTAAANETFEAWREGLHDDLVLAVAMAAWIAEKDTGGSGILPFSCKPTPQDQQRMAAKGVPLGRYGRPG
jgi:hypothetical protein